MGSLKTWVVMTAVLCGLASPALAQDAWHQSLDEARREAQRLNRPLLLHFGATWCGPCRVMEGSVLNQPRVQSELRANIVGVKFDVDQHPDLANRFLVNSVPTDIFLEPDGKELLISPAQKSLDDYLVVLQRASTRYKTLLVQREARQSTPIVTNPIGPGDGTQLVKNADPMVMLEGYCPFTLAVEKQWIRGRPEFASVFEGQKFLFATAEAREKFLATPERYAPQYKGCDPVIAWTADRSILGSIEWAAFYDERLYLFATEENRKSFKASPDKYITTKIVLHVDDIETVWK